MLLRVKILLTLVVVGLIPTLIVAAFSLSISVSSLKQSSFDQLVSIKEIKRNSVNNYLNSMMNQVSVMSQNQSIIDALAGFKNSFDSVASEFNISSSETKSIKSELTNYYDDNFIDTLRNINPDSNVSASSLTKALNLNALVLQKQFIVDNPNPTGKKHLLNSIVSSNYSNDHERIHPFLKSYLERFGFYDIFLIDAESGNIMYSVFKEIDFATSLKSGPYANSGLAMAFNLALSAPQNAPASVVDFKPYLPSFNAPAGFLASPIYDDQNNMLGVLAFQFPIQKLNDIMGERAGLGETGETYLVGPDRLMRSDSYLDPVNHSVMASFQNPDLGKVDTQATQLALNGKSGVDIIIDYNNNPVLSAYAPLNFSGLDWAILAEIDESEALAPVKKLIWIIICVLILALIGIVVVGIIVSKNIMKPLGGEPTLLEAIAKQIASGDLRVDTEDKSATGLLRSMMAMAKDLRRIVTQIYEVSHQQSAAAEELSAITTETSNNIVKQDESTELVATAMTQMTSTVSEVAMSTQTASENIKQTRSSLNKNVTEVNHSSVEMTSVSDSLDIAKNKIDALKQSTEDIVTILLSITNIADQTNLLALNAAIEAARAGEQGRGFAVVADEVRSLAQNTQESTEEISRMISILKTHSDEVNVAIETSLTKASGASKSSVQTAKDLSEILRAVGGIDDMIFQIAGAAEEQSVVAEDINQRVVDIRDMSVETNEASVQTKIASEELARLSSELQDMVTHFRLN